MNYDEVNQVVGTINSSDTAYRYYLLGYMYHDGLIDEAVSKKIIANWNELSESYFNDCLNQTKFAVELCRKDPRKEMVKMSIDSISSYAYRLPGDHSQCRHLVLAGFGFIHPNLLMEYYQEEFGDLVVPVAQQQEIIWRLNNNKFVGFEVSKKTTTVVANAKQLVIAAASVPPLVTKREPNLEEIFPMIYSGDFNIKEGQELAGYEKYSMFYSAYRNWEKKNKLEPKAFITSSKAKKAEKEAAEESVKVEEPKQEELPIKTEPESLKEDKPHELSAEEKERALMEKASKENSEYIENSKKFSQTPEVPMPSWKKRPYHYSEEQRNNNRRNFDAKNYKVFR